MKHATKKAHDDYIDNYILNDFDNKPKQFWKHIKAKRFSSTRSYHLTKMVKLLLKQKTFLTP